MDSLPSLVGYLPEVVARSSIRCDWLQRFRQDGFSSFTCS